MRMLKFIKRKKVEFIMLAGLFLVGGFVYFYKLDSIPPGFYIDEALPGYNAFSLLKTSKDEYGKFLPVALRFYGSYNPPLFTFLVVPFIKYLGLNIFAVRFPAAVFGLLTLLPVFFLLETSGVVRSKLAVFMTVFIFVITPWNILYSRVGYEVSLGLLLFSAGVLAFWHSLKRSKVIILGFLLLSLSTYAAYAERFLAPLFLLGFVFIFRRKFIDLEFKKHFFRGAILAFITQIPNFTILLTPAFFPKSDLFSSAITSQANKINFYYPVSVVLSFAYEFFSHYIAYFSPRNLFFLPDPDQQRSIPELSVFYFWVSVPYFVGLFQVFKKNSKPFSKLLIFLLAITPIPASLTKDPFSTHRALAHLLPITLVVGFGIDALVSRFPKKVILAVFSGAILFSMLLVWRSYFILLPKERAIYWGYGIRELSLQIAEKPEMHFVIDQARTKPIYMQLAFFLQFSPVEFQKLRPEIAKNYYENLPFNSNYIFANLETRNIDWNKDAYSKQMLVGDSLTISERQAEEHFLDRTFVIKDPLENIIFVGYETNPEKKCFSDPSNINCINYE